ncbi:glycosyl transferase family 64 domain-containing protein [Limtongia smithiae]|uniref:glycosyl transferase family 64 domain-containing protein n=1 Tax=Limtongia smithiae TaxID=1125753 RepID=UPI0034CE9B87
MLFYRLRRTRLPKIFLSNVVTFLIALSIGLLLASSSSISQAVYSVQSVKTASASTVGADGRSTFLTSICRGEDVLPAKALVHSIERSGTGAKINVLVLSSINEQDRAELISLGAVKVIDIASITPSGFDTTDRLNIYEHDMCAMSAIHAFALVDYNKVLYLRPDMLVRENIDNLFQYSPLAGTTDSAGAVDGSVLLVRPSIARYKRLLSARASAANGTTSSSLGFFSTEYSGFTPLEAIYNVQVIYDQLPYAESIFKNAKIYNYNGSLKAWDLFADNYKNWRDIYNEDMIFEWRQMEYSMNARLHPDAELEKWREERGSTHICRSYLDRKTNVLTRRDDKYTVLLATHSLRRQETLPFVARQLLRSQYVDKIFIIWHKEQTPVSLNIRRLIEEQHGRIVIIKQPMDTINNRFNPIPEIDTKGVLVVDDDVWTPQEDIDRAFEAWRLQEDSLVGFAPRADCKNDGDSIKYCFAQSYNPAKYSIILTKIMFMDSNFLFLWRCGISDSILKYVDDLINCEDIAMNFLTTGVSKKPSFHVYSESVYDFGLENGISTKPDHWKTRSTCTQHFVDVFHKNPLIQIKGSYAPFSKGDFQSTTWERFLDMYKEVEQGVQEWEME